MYLVGLCSGCCKDDCSPHDDRRGRISMAVVRELSGSIPILGIFLRRQCIGSVFGGRVARARHPMHGRSSYVTHDGRGLFNEIPSPVCVGRYYSLVVELDESSRRISLRRRVRKKARSWRSQVPINQPMAYGFIQNRSRPKGDPELKLRPRSNKPGPIGSHCPV